MNEPWDNLWATAGGIYFGVNRKGEEKLYTGPQNIFTSGTTGAGKTRRLLLPAIHRLAGKWSMTIVDIKGELTTMLADYCEAMGAEVIVLDPFGISKRPSRGFNPVQSMPLDDDMPDNALAHGEALIKVFERSNDPHFPQAAQDLWAGFELYVRAVIEDGSLEDVRMFLSYPIEDLQELILAPKIKYKGKEYPGILRFATTKDWPEIAAKVNRYSDIKPDNKEYLGILSSGLVQTRWLDSRRIKADLRGPAFDFREMKDRPVVLFICIPPKRLGTHAPWLRQVVTSCVQGLMDDVKKAKVPCLIALDEFYAIAEGSFDIITKNMAAFRGYGIKLWTIWQDLSQTQKLLGRDGFETFLANAGIVQSFAPQDLTTSRYLSERTGQKTEIALSPNLGSSRQAGGLPSRSEGIGASQVGVPVMLPQEIRAMRKGDTLVLSPEIEHGQGIYHAPYPTEIPRLKEIMKLDPTA